MSDKKVILNKTEFDNMETELSNLRKVVESRTIAKIKTPHLGWSPTYGASYIDSYFIEYVFGTEENEVIKELSAEITALKQTNASLNDILTLHEASIFRLQRQENDWKNLPWYKRLFFSVN
jgi:hypothetical protein